MPDTQDQPDQPRDYGTVRVFSPVPSFTGESAGVAFARGVALVNLNVRENRKAMSYFRQAGYLVEPVDGPTEWVEEVEQPGPDTDKAPGPDAEPGNDNPVVTEPPLPPLPAPRADKGEWIAAGVLRGMSTDEADTLNKQDLVAWVQQLDADLTEQRKAQGGVDETPEGGQHL